MVERNVMMTTETPEPRTCINCACHSIQHDMTNPLLSQMFCRRDPPIAQQMRLERPRMRDGKVVMGRDGKTAIMEQVQEIVYMYRPTKHSLTCFDGWRALGTEPGQRDIGSIDGMTGALKKLWSDMLVQQQESSFSNPEEFANKAGQTMHVDNLGEVHDGLREECAYCQLADQSKKD